MIRTFFSLILRGVTDLRLNPWAQLLTLAAVTLVAFLAGLFILFLHNLNEELLRTRGEAVFQVYWTPDTDLETVRAQWEEIANLEFLTDLITYTPEQAMDTLSSELGPDIDLSWLQDKEDTLPATALVSFSPQGQDPGSWTEAMLARLEALPGVDKVHYNPVKTHVAKSWAAFARRITWPAMGFLLLVLSLVVGNTIKLSLVNRRDEIDILRLVGARNWYIQLPLLVTGAVQGILGGILAVAMLKALQVGLKDLLNFPPFSMEFTFPPMDQALLFVAVLAAVGVLSSWVAVRN